MTIASYIKRKIRSVPDFPKQGVLFRDVSPLLMDSKLFKASVEEMMRPFRLMCDHVAAIESRGFIFGSAAAELSGKGMVLLRKPGKLPPPVAREEYDLEYGKDSLEILVDIVRPGSEVILVDDVLATGGTAVAAVNLLQKIGAKVVGATFLIDLPFLGGAEKLYSLGIPVASVVKYSEKDA